MRYPCFAAICLIAVSGCARPEARTAATNPTSATAQPAAASPKEQPATIEEAQTLLAIHSTIVAAFESGEKTDLAKIALLGQTLTSGPAKRLKQQLFDLAAGAEELPKLAESWQEEKRRASRAKSEADALQASVKYAASRLGYGGAAATREFDDLIKTRIPEARKYEDETAARAFQAKIKAAAEFERLKAQTDSIKSEIERLRGVAPTR